MPQERVERKHWDAVELLASWWGTVEIELAVDLDRSAGWTACLLDVVRRMIFLWSLAMMENRAGQWAFL